MNSPDLDTPSTRPYLIRALHEWCVDNGYSPYVAVQVDASVKVPMEFVKNGEIVLNVSFDATSSLRLGNDFIEFKARFGGVAREIVVPVSHVIAIYARENGQGMAFPAPTAPSIARDGAHVVPPPAHGADPASQPEAPGRGPSLRAVPNEDPLAKGHLEEPDPGVPPPDGPPKPGRPQLKRVK